MKKLKIGRLTVEVSETGAFTVKVSVSLPFDPRIYDSVPAIVDGTVSADFYQSDKKVGSALLVLPCNGVDRQAVEVEGICLEGVDASKPYRIEFSPYKLWAIER